MKFVALTNMVLVAKLLDKLHTKCQVHLLLGVVEQLAEHLDQIQARERDHPQILADITIAVGRSSNTTFRAPSSTPTPVTLNSQSKNQTMV